jgi:hypothetical protein
MLAPRLRVALALAGGSLACVQVDADLPQTCFLQSGVSIAALEGVEAQGALDALQAAADDAGIELPSALPTVAVEESFTRDGLEDIPQTIDDVGADASVSLMFVDVIATRGLESFESIDRVAMTAVPTDPASGLEPLTLARCDRAAGCEVSGTRVTLRGAERDLLPYLRAGELEFTLALEGRPPLEVWSFDVDVCLQGTASYSHEL